MVIAGDHSEIIEADSSVIPTVANESNIDESLLIIAAVLQFGYIHSHILASGFFKSLTS